MSLPIFKSEDREFMMLQTRWSSEINPALASPFATPSILKDIQLVSGTNVINHRLGKKPVGWILIDTNTPITLYRTADYTDLTITLVSSGAAKVSLAVI